MNPERLLVLCLRSGIDLGFIAQLEPPKERMRPRVNAAIRERQLRVISALPGERKPKGLPSELFRTARGKQGRLTKAPEWTPADFAASCRAMPELSWSALCFTVMPNDDDRMVLKSALLAFASRVAVAEKWPDKIRRGNCQACGKASRERYLEDLCTLALTEWTHPDALRTQDQLAAWFSVSRPTWNQRVAKRYEHIRGRLEIWYGGAIGHLWRSLTPDSNRGCVESRT